jgi:hypothetical protein
MMKRFKAEPGDVPAALGRKSSAVFPEHTENPEPGSGSKTLELAVCVRPLANIQRRLPLERSAWNDLPRVQEIFRNR